MTRTHQAEGEKPTLVDLGVATTNPVFAGAVLTAAMSSVPSTSSSWYIAPVSFSMWTGAPGSSVVTFGESPRTGSGKLTNTATMAFQAQPILATFRDPVTIAVLRDSCL